MKKLLIIVGLLLNITFAQINVDKTRVIFDRDVTKSEVIMLSNTSSTSPFLAQSWIEDESGNKIEGPLMALPVIMRVNPGQSKQVRINTIGDVAQLPVDRESLFFFNVLGIPPANKVAERGGNFIEIAIQTTLKIFYRPKGLPNYSSSEVMGQVRVEKHQKGFSLQNPSPYYVTIFGVSVGENTKMKEEAISVKPFSTVDIPTVVKSSVLKLHYVGDFGEINTARYSCRTNQCTLVQ